MKLGIIADDNTGASDAAGMLTERGVPTLLAFDMAGLAGGDVDVAEYAAMVVGTGIRSTSVAVARERTAHAVKHLKALGVDRFQIKYCSTFDSTKEGNIGPSLDAAREALATEGCIVCPALPVNGRTVYQGHLFVHDQLLSESPLRDHPLNPMTDADLVRWLQHQTLAQVGLAPLSVVRQGPRALARSLAASLEQHIRYIVTDAVDDQDLRQIATATRDWPLTSGGSGLTAAMAEELFPDQEPLRFHERLASISSRTAVISGSMSPATQAQTAHALAHGFHEFALDVRAAVAGKLDLDVFTTPVLEALKQGHDVLVHAPAGDPKLVADTQAWGRGQGLDAVATGTRIAEALADVGKRLMKSEVIGRLIVSGGETSGVACARLGFDVLEVGLPVAPGVPYGFPLHSSELLVALKSGNFGGPDLYERIRALA